MTEKNRLFREKPLERMQSPESLNEYLKVTTPALWIVMAAVALILIGAIVWSCLGHIEATEQVAVVSDGSKTVCLVPEDDLDAVAAAPEVKVEDETIALKPDATEPVTVGEDTDVYILMAGNIQPGDIVYQIESDTSLKEGVYEGRIVTETITPISFLLN